jgi:predicted DNA-binding transcriptional regulator AlpA
VSDDNQEFTDERALGDWLNLSPITLQAWRRQGKGPRFFKVGRLVRYSVADVRAWLAANMRGGKVA